MRVGHCVAAHAVEAEHPEGPPVEAAAAVEGVQVGVDAEAGAAAPREGAPDPAEAAVVLVVSHVDAAVPAAQAPSERRAPIPADTGASPAEFPPRRLRMLAEPGGGGGRGIVGVELFVIGSCGGQCSSHERHHEQRREG